MAGGRFTEGVLAGKIEGLLARSFPPPLAGGGGGGGGPRQEKRRRFEATSNRPVPPTPSRKGWRRAFLSQPAMFHGGPMDDALIQPLLAEQSNVTQPKICAAGIDTPGSASMSSTPDGSILAIHS